MNDLKVVILCGGKGHRLRPLTSSIPKPMVRLNGKPILQHIIEFYIRSGFNSFILCTGFKSNVIKKFVSSKKFKADIEISDAGEQASMLKRLYKARHLMGKKVIVTYGDTFINIDSHRLINKHNKGNAKATITVANIRSPFGLVRLGRNKKVLSFDEKPLLPHYIGHMILDRDILDDLDRCLIRMPDGEGLVSLFKKLISEGKLNSYEHSGLQITFNTVHEHKKAEEEFIKFFTGGE